MFFFFISDRIRTLAAIATYSFYRLIIGKVEIDNIFCLNGDIWNVLQKRLLNSPQCFISLVQIVVFDWLSGNKKVKCFEKKKYVKISFTQKS